jgi:tRNA-specific 2-thiouridylase
MKRQANKIVVAMSGGVDSSVAAALLAAEGYEVEGVSLRMWEENRGERVCSDHRGAAEVARLLGIPHTLLDLRGEFERAVVKPFVNDYLRGRTPNPCISCNRDFKLGMLLEWARARGAVYVATGHYARVIRSEPGSPCRLFRGVDRAKDQSYFLFSLSQEQLARTLFPLGGMAKSDVRERARRWGLPAAERAESQDICFGDYRELVSSRAGKRMPPNGDVIDRNGKVLGRHGGIHSVTVGQRRGLGISAAEPLYVVEIDNDANRVVVGKRAELSCAGLLARGVSWLETPNNSPIEAEVQIRYRAPAIPCTIRSSGDGACEIRFQEPCQAVTPGQAAVFYRGEQLLGGGWIERGLR